MASNAEPRQDGMGANVSLTFNPDGEKVSGFTKLHPVPVYKEDLHYEKGKTIETFECNGFTVSPLSATTYASQKSFGSQQYGARTC